MRDSEQTFSLESWLKQGAIIGRTGEWVETYWGDITSYAEPIDASTAIYQNDFFLKEEKPWKVFSAAKRWQWDQWQTYIKKQLSSFDVEQLTWQEPRKERFRQTFKDILGTISAGKILKAVPVVYEKSHKQNYSQLQSLVNSPDNTHIYGYWQSGRGFLGYTPELLFKKSPEGLLEFMALAGTCFREDFNKDSDKFVNNPKERKEHQIVVDDIQKKITDLGEVRVGDTHCLKLDQLVHLCTNVFLQGEKSISFQELVSRLHPTSALGVFPPEKLDLLESWRDSWSLLGAPFGVRWNAENYLCLVAIRHLQWDEKDLYIGAGCGLVEESELEQEWRELFIKRESVKNMLSL